VVLVISGAGSLAVQRLFELQANDKVETLKYSVMIIKHTMVQQFPIED